MGPFHCFFVYNLPQPGHAFHRCGTILLFPGLLLFRSGCGIKIRAAHSSQSRFHCHTLSGIRQKSAAARNASVLFRYYSYFRFCCNRCAQDSRLHRRQSRCCLRQATCSKESFCAGGRNSNNVCCQNCGCRCASRRTHSIQAPLRLYP